jgi:hypothetical protein
MTAQMQARALRAADPTLNLYISRTQAPFANLLFVRLLYYMCVFHRVLYIRSVLFAIGFSVLYENTTKIHNFYTFAEGWARAGMSHSVRSVSIVAESLTP